MPQVTSTSASDIPKNGWVERFLPPAVQPYARLARLDRPIGTWLLLFPCWWGVALAANGLPDAFLIVVFAAGAIVMRGAGCTYNDLVDVDIDEQVERTRSRPLPSGKVSKRQAWAFLVLQSLAGLLVLVQFNGFAIGLGIASLVVVAIYPFMKRFTNWPQLVLGLAFSWGALMGWAAEYADLERPAVLLYLASIFWVIGYDTIYAHQDKDDDALIGVKSSALRLGAKTRLALWLFYGGAVAFFAAAGAAAEVAWPFYAGLAAAAAQLAWQAKRVDLDDPADCLAKFRSNALFGWLFLAGVLAGRLSP